MIALVFSPANWQISPFLLLLLIVMVAVYAVERIRHRAMLRRIPIRVHVNGTRGKSSVTRLIAAGLRAGGIRTIAKSTGSAARFIHADGSEEPIRRLGSPNIREQIDIFRRAADERADALVIECMAVRPDLQFTSEKGIVQSNIGVITNVRPDHLEVMGPDLQHVAIALSGTIPTNGELFTAETRFAEFFREKAESANSRFHLTTLDQEPTTEEMDRFGYVEIPENVGLALAVCRHLEIDRETALRGMYEATPDVGATTRIRVHRDSKELTFLNVFAANDAHSTVFLWRFLGLDKPGDRQVGVLINNRADRLRRAVDVARIIAADIHADWYIVAGAAAGTFCAMAARNGVPSTKLIDMGGASAEAVLGRIFDLTRGQSTVMGIGNIGGFGIRFMELIEKERKGHDS
ncbi:MAG: poly-gamma-glutamate synthase PgsB [Candidatus Eisenbacteria bacterium]